MTKIRDIKGIVEKLPACIKGVEESSAVSRLVLSTKLDINECACIDVESVTELITDWQYSREVVIHCGDSADAKLQLAKAIVADIKGEK